MRQSRKSGSDKNNRLKYAREISKTCNAVQDEIKDFFFCSNEASTECPGRKQGRAYNGEQRQRRCLRDDIKQLHRQFLSKNSKYVCYRSFCRNKPAWVVKPKLSARDTCLCKECENLKYLFKACKSNDLLNHASCKEFIESLCCSPEASTECFLRTCDKCKHKTVKFLNQNEEKPAMYNEWVLASETKYSVKAKKEVTFKITRKVSQYCTVAELKKLLVTKVFSYMKHLGRNRHQTKASDHIIKNLKPNEMAIAVDWSMNYCGKYGKETQSVHFGGSHEQIALHTGRVYTSGGESKSFCTLSENTRHDKQAIAAHLVPVLCKYLSEFPQVNKIFFMSDGPVSQYKNRDLYCLVTQYLTELFPQIVEIEWVFSESGHGKGEPDGVGAQQSALLIMSLRTAAMLTA